MGFDFLKNLLEVDPTLQRFIAEQNGFELGDDEDSAAAEAEIAMLEQELRDLQSQNEELILQLDELALQRFEMEENLRRRKLLQKVKNVLSCILFWQLIFMAAIIAISIWRLGFKFEKEQLKSEFKTEEYFCGLGTCIKLPAAVWANTTKRVVVKCKQSFWKSGILDLLWKPLYCAEEVPWWLVG